MTEQGNNWKKWSPGWIPEVHRSVPVSGTFNIIPFIDYKQAEICDAKLKEQKKISQDIKAQFGARIAVDVARAAEVG